MRRRPTGSRVRHSGQRRKLVWSTQSFAISMAASHNETVDLLAPLEVAGASKLGVTVMRTIVDLYVETTVSLGDTFSWGLMVMDSNLIGTDVAGSPNAAVQADFDWAWLDFWHTATGPGNGANASYGDYNNHLHYDVRSKRKCEEMNQTWGLALHTTTALDAVGFVISTRTLVALP